MPVDNQVKVRAALRLCERLGVLDRVMVPHAIPLDNESVRKIFPPRLFYLPKFGIVAHALGDDSFYELHPEYVKGGVSKEIHILDKAPMHLSNFFAMEETYAKIPGLSVVDKQRRAGQ